LSEKSESELLLDSLTGYLEETVKERFYGEVVLTFRDGRLCVFKKTETHTAESLLESGRTAEEK